MDNEKSDLNTCNNKTLICNNLPLNLMDELMAREHFESFGKLVNLVVDSKSILTVTYATVEEAKLALIKGNNCNGQVFEMSYAPTEVNNTNDELIRNKEEATTASDDHNKLMRFNQELLPKIAQIIWEYINHTCPEKKRLIRGFQRQDSVHEKEPNMIDIIYRKLGLKQYDHHHEPTLQMTLTHELTHEIRNLFGKGDWFHFLLDSKRSIQKLRFSDAEKLMGKCSVKDVKIKEENLYKYLSTLTGIHIHNVGFQGGFILLTLNHGNMQNKLAIAIGPDKLAIKIVEKFVKMKNANAIKAREGDFSSGVVAFKPVAETKTDDLPSDNNLDKLSSLGQLKLYEAKISPAVLNQVESNQMEKQTENLYQQLIDGQLSSICVKEIQINQLTLDFYHSLVDNLVQMLTKKHFDRVQYDLRLMRCSYLGWRDVQNQRNSEPLMEHPHNNPQLQPVLDSPKLDLWQILSETLPEIGLGARRFYKLILSLPVGLVGDKLEEQLDRDLLKYSHTEVNGVHGNSFYIRGLSKGIALSVMKIRDLKKCPYLGHANGIVCFGHGHQLLEVKQRLHLLAKCTLCPFIIFIIERISSEMNHREKRHQQELVKSLRLKDESFLYWRIYKYRPGGLIATLQSGINCLASLPSVNCQKVLQQVNFREFLFNHLGPELFDRLRKNMALLELCQKFPQLCQQIYNEAIRRLQLVAGEDLSMMPHLPQELYEYVEPLNTLNTSRWEYFQHNWKTKKSRQILVKFMETIKMPEIGELPNSSNHIQWLKDYIAQTQEKKNINSIVTDSLQSLHHSNGYLNIFAFWANKRLNCILDQKDIPCALVYQVSSLGIYFNASWFHQFLQTTPFNIYMDRILMPPPARPGRKRVLERKKDNSTLNKRLRLIK